MTTAALIVAAGRGLRLGGPVPKQFQDLGGDAILTRTLRVMLASKKVDCVLTVIHGDYKSLYDKAVAQITDDRLLPPVPGGTERADSVRLGLEALQPHAPDQVLIHDAARPFVTVGEIDQIANHKCAAILAEPVTDALWKADSDGDRVDHPVPREQLWRAQTPQAFPYEKILAAHRAAEGHEKPALDDAETYRRAGHDVVLMSGGPDNFKITTSADMERAKRLIAATEQNMEYRNGHGFDVHRFVPGDGVWLCGVHIPHEARLDGHSDADVGLHATADALYGALAEGDIGRHFPPTDPQWRGAASHIFLEHAAKLVGTHGGRIVNVDITLLCERPKIGPHAHAMAVRMAEIMKIDASRVSIKATTMERMGFVGREEGMGCIANATIAVPA